MPGLPRGPTQSRAGASLRARVYSFRTGGGATMIQRRALSEVRARLASQATVGLIGPRQVGKTTLAPQIAEDVGAVYLDHESRSARSFLAEPALNLEEFEDGLVVLDEIHHAPEIFRELRGIIDRGRQRGLRTGRFLILGSASMDLLRQTGESLAGRIAYVPTCSAMSRRWGGGCPKRPWAGYRRCSPTAKVRDSIPQGSLRASA